MKSIINRHTAVWQKFAGISLAIMFGLVSLLPSTAEARLIFTTEDDGVNADAYHLDNDDSSADFIDLGFGTGLTNRLRYDIVNTQFMLNQNLNLEGNDLKDFRVENAAAALTCAAAGDKGRMYYDTVADDLFFCDGTQWVSTSANSTALAGDGLVANGAALDVNVDDSTIEIATDVVKVKDGGIDTAQLAADAVTTAQIAADTILAGDIATGAVTTDEILDGTVTTGDINLAGFTIGSGQITDGSLTAADLGTDSVGADEIIDGSITTSDINLTGFEVGSGQITDGSITAADLGTDSVGSDEISAGAVDTSELAADAVTTAQIAADTILAGDIATGAVTTDEILDGTVGTADMTAGANNTFLTTDGTGNVVWELKSNFMSSALASGSMWVGDGTGTAAAVAMNGDATMDNAGALTIAGDAITTGKIAAGAVENSDLAADAVNSAKIADESITSADLGTDSVGSDEISAGAVDTAELAADAVTTAQIAADTILAGDIATGAVTTDEILDGTVGTGDLNASGVGNNKTLTTDGSGNMVWVDDAAVDREVSAHVAPEFANFTLNADGSNNKGSLESDHDGTANKNYYKWKTRKTGTMQDYDVVFQWMVPDDFKSWSTTNPSIEVDYKTDTTSATDNKLDITMSDTAGTAATLAGTASNMVSTTADTWVEDQVVAAASLAGTYTPGEYVTITIKMSSKATTTANKNPAYLGAFNFNYVAK